MIQETLSGATEKLPSWRPQGIPLDEQEREALRQLCIEAVFSIWNREQRPAHLSEIWQMVRSKTTHGKRTVDRRVNEAASPLFSGPIPKIVAVTSGIYQPNPRLFEVVSVNHEQKESV